MTFGSGKGAGCKWKGVDVPTSQKYQYYKNCLTELIQKNRKIVFPTID